MEQYLEIGKVVSTHGLRGELRVDPWCDSPQFLCQFKTLYLKKGETKLSVSSRPHKTIAIVKAKGIDTIEEAEKLRGRVLYINRSDARLAPGEYFIQDLMGLDVIDIDTSKSYGKITDVLKTGANDVYQVTDEKKKDYLIPVIDDGVKEIDINGGKVLSKPLKGLFDDED